MPASTDNFFSFTAHFTKLDQLIKFKTCSQLKQLKCGKAWKNAIQE